MLLLVSSALPQFNLSAIDIYDEHYKISSVWAVFKIKVYANIFVYQYLLVGPWSAMWVVLGAQSPALEQYSITGVMWCNAM